MGARVIEPSRPCGVVLALVADGLVADFSVGVGAQGALRHEEVCLVAPALGELDEGGGNALASDSSKHEVRHLHVVESLDPFVSQSTRFVIVLGAFVQHDNAVRSHQFLQVGLIVHV